MCQSKSGLGATNKQQAKRKNSHQLPLFPRSTFTVIVGSCGASTLAAQVQAVAFIFVSVTARKF